MKTAASARPSPCVTSPAPDSWPCPPTLTFRSSPKGLWSGLRRCLLQSLMRGMMAPCFDSLWIWVMQLLM